MAVYEGTGMFRLEVEAQTAREAESIVERILKLRGIPHCIIDVTEAKGADSSEAKAHNVPAYRS